MTWNERKFVNDVLAQNVKDVLAQNVNDVMLDTACAPTVFPFLLQNQFAKLISGLIWRIASVCSLVLFGDSDIMNPRKAKNLIRYLRCGRGDI